MAEVPKFNMQNSDAVMVGLEKAAKSVAKKFGVNIRRNGFRYGDGSTTFSFRADVPGFSAQEYRKHAKELGLPANGVGRKFEDKGHICSIVGADMNKRYEVIMRRDGSEWSYRADQSRNF